ncbi:MAG: hypothetical protein AABY22_16585 [Nanoarchaeota archaeon]
MKIIVNKQIGKSSLEVEVEGAEEMDALVRASSITTMPDKCGLCSSDDVQLTSNKAQEKYTYVKVRCLNPKCGASSTMGLYQDKSGAYWKPFEIYKKDSK